LIGAGIVLLTAPDGAAGAQSGASATFQVEPIVGAGELGASLHTRF